MKYVLAAMAGAFLALLFVKSREYYYRYKAVLWEERAESFQAELGKTTAMWREAEKRAAEGDVVMVARANVKLGLMLWSYYESLKKLADAQRPRWGKANLSHVWKTRIIVTRPDGNEVIQDYALTGRELNDSVVKPEVLWLEAGTRVMKNLIYMALKGPP